MKRVLLTILGLTLTAFAFWPAGGVKVVETPDVIENPQMVYINDGSVVISWEADRQIYCQKLDTTGMLHWDAEGDRVCLSDFIQSEHQIVTDGQDVWFVWTDMRNDEGGDIYAQKVSGTTGQRLWGEQGKAVCVKQEEPFSDQSKPRFALLDNEALGIAWEDFPNWDIYVQYLQPDGTLLWDSTGLEIPNAQHWGRSRPYVASSGEDFIIACYENRFTEDDFGVLFQKFNQTGEYLFDTSSPPFIDSSIFLKAIGDEHKGCVVFRATDYGLYVFRIDSLGNPVWGESGIQLENQELGAFSSLLLQEDLYPSYTIVPDGEGGCFASWRRGRVQHVESSGSLTWDNDLGFYRCREYETIEGVTSLCPDGTGGILTAYSTRYSFPEEPYFYEASLSVQRVKATGELAFDSSGIKLRFTTSGNTNYSAKDAVSIPRGIMTVWVDDRNDPMWSLYAQTVDTAGKVGSRIDEKPISLTQFSLELETNVISENLNLRYSLPQGERGVIMLFDATGRLLNSQILNQKEEVITINTHDFPRGVYFVQLKTSKNSTISEKILIVN